MIISNILSQPPKSPLKKFHSASVLPVPGPTHMSNGCRRMMHGPARFGATELSHAPTCKKKEKPAQTKVVVGVIRHIYSLAS